MITMHNVVKRGRTAWDRALLPEDEYGERVRLVREAMAREGIDALVGVGHTASYGSLTYLTGNVPPLGWMAVVLGRESGPCLVTGGGSRDLPFLSTQTWISDIRPSASLFTGPAEVVAHAVGEMVGFGGTIALAGARENLGVEAYRELLAALPGRALADGDALLAALRAVKRPRERVAARRALEIARAAVDAALDAWEAGAPNAIALLVAEREARLRGARDARVLGTLTGPWLEPVEDVSEERLSHLALTCAVECVGYWGQACGDSGSGLNPAHRAVDAMTALVRAGVPVAELARAAEGVELVVRPRRRDRPRAGRSPAGAGGQRRDARRGRGGRAAGLRGGRRRADLRGRDRRRGPRRGGPARRKQP